MSDRHRPTFCVRSFSVVFPAAILLIRLFIFYKKTGAAILCFCTSGDGVFRRHNEYFSRFSTRSHRRTFCVHLNNVF